MKEYIVTLKNKEDLENFYHDMETLGGSLYIPDRRVECCCRRSISRNTHYMLTEQEVLLLRQDSRVAAVERVLRDLNVKIQPAYTQTSNQWSRSFFNITSGDLNHGLIRVFEGENRLGWDGVNIERVTGSIESDFYTGKDVDVVILDGDLDKNHPEFAKNSDGTGGSRLVEYNWFSLNPTVDPDNLNTNYVYNIFNTSESYHGHHVAGIAIGNTQGFAKQANIYNLNPYGEKGLDGSILFDYIRAFHNNKPVNPQTGVKNPTIVNASIEFIYEINLNLTTAINYRGTTYTSPWTNNNILKESGVIDRSIFSNQTILNIPASLESLKADIEDAINDGIIIITAAGNSNLKIDVSGGIDYNNYLVHSGVQYFYNRGGVPGVPGKSIVVGSAGYSTDPAEFRSTTSNTGPGVDVFAPGERVVSCTLSGDSNGVTDDFRNNSYSITKKSGTSMSSPQVCGVIASLLEQNKTWNQYDAKSWIIANSKLGQLTTNTYNPFNPSINSSLIRALFPLSGENSFVIGGGFTSVNNISVSGACKMNYDGNVDELFSLRVPVPQGGQIQRIKLINNEKILICGQYNSINNINSPCVSVLDLDFSVNTSFLSEITTQINDAQMLDNGDVVTVGSNRFRRLNSSGQIMSDWSKTFTGPTTVAVCLHVLDDQSVIVGGAFEGVDGVTRRGLVKINSNKAIDSFNPNVTRQGNPGRVASILPAQGGGFIIGGIFDAVGGVPRTNIAKINNDGSVSSDFNISNLNIDIIDMFYNQNYDIFVAGIPKLFGPSYPSVKKIKSTGVIDELFSISHWTGSGQKQCWVVLPTQDGGCILAGDISRINNLERSNIAKVNKYGELEDGLYWYDLNGATNSFLYFNSTTKKQQLFLKNNKLLFKNNKLLISKQN